MVGLSPLYRLVLLVFVALLANGCESSASVEQAIQEAQPLPSCAPGKRPLAGTNTCDPVGPIAVPTGFVAEEWGFHPVLPSKWCTGPTIAMLGKTDCQPLGTCDGAFPPVEASLVVRASGAPDPQHPGLPVVKTLAEALHQVASGAVVAIDEGEFELPASIDKSIRLVGRCPARTSLVGNDFGIKVSKIHLQLSSLSLSGCTKAVLLANSGADVSLDHVWMHGLRDAIAVANHAHVHITNSAIEGPKNSLSENRAAAGVSATYQGHATLENVEIRGYQTAVFAQSSGTEVKVRTSVLHEQARAGADSGALAVLGSFVGARILIDGSHVESTPGRIAIVGSRRLDGMKDPTSPENPPALLEVRSGSLVHRGVDGAESGAIDVVDAATARFHNVSIRHDSFTAIGAGEQSSVELHDAVILTNANTGAPRVAITLVDRSSATLDGVALVGATQSAVDINGASSLEMSRSLVYGTTEFESWNPTLRKGSAQAISVSPNGRAEIRDSAFVDNQGTSLFLSNATGTIERTMFTGTRAASFGRFTSAVTSVDSKFVVQGSVFSRNERAFAVRAGVGLLRDSTVNDNHEAFRLDGVTLVETGDANHQPAMAQVALTRTEVVRNVVRVDPKPLTDE